MAQTDQEHAGVHEVEWRDVRARVKEALSGDGPFFTAIDTVAKKLGAKNRRLVLASCPYGESILDDGELVLPCADVNPGLGSSTPLGMILSNSVEIFRKERRKVFGSNQRYFDTFPYALLRQGELFGVFETVDRVYTQDASDEPSRWNMTAGARSVHLIYPLGQAPVKQRLGEIGLGWSFVSPGDQLSINERNLDYQSWELLMGLARCGDPGAEHKPPWPECDWRADMLFFPDAWFTKADGPAARELQRFMLLKAWQQSAGIRIEHLSRETLRGRVHAVRNHLSDLTKSKNSTLLALEVLSYLESVLQNVAPCHRLYHGHMLEGIEHLGPFSAVDQRLRSALHDMKLKHETVYAVPRHRQDGKRNLIALSRPPRTGVLSERSWIATLKDLMEVYSKLTHEHSDLKIDSVDLVPIQKGLVCKNAQSSQTGVKKLRLDIETRALLGIEIEITKLALKNPFINACLAVGWPDLDEGTDTVGG